MYTLTRSPRRLLLTGAILAIAALVATLVAVSFATGPAQAQDRGNTYPDPQPCGPGANTAFMHEPHEVTSGDFALFEAYWRTIGFSTGIDASDDQDVVGVLHTNLCPPEMVTTTKRVGPRTVEVTTRSPRANGMDVDEAIMHVLDTPHKVDVVATNDEATAGQLSLEKYHEVRDFAPAGSQVWWLRLDDPDTEADEASDLSIGFSTLLLNDGFWLTSDEGQPMSYKFLVERYPAEPTDEPHFFAYEAPKAGGTEAELVWNSLEPGEGAMEMDPGEFRALQWVFTKPGTYILSVHLEGHVRHENPYSERDNPDEHEEWSAISDNLTETSEVKRYTIQVGNELNETEPPIFGVNLSVGEKSAAGDSVGSPISVYNADADVLYYRLVDRDDQEPSDDFETVASTDGSHTVQIVVKEGASLDYDTRPAYEFELSVTDKVDHEKNPNPYADDILIVRIDVEEENSN